MCICLLLALLAANPLFAAGRPNVVLISIDTLRSSALGIYGNKQISTPNMDAFGKSGVVFKNEISAVPLTLPSHISLLTGLLPLHHGIHNNSLFRLTMDHVSMATIFHQNGYRTQAFVSSWILDHHVGLDQGFDGYDDQFQTTGDEASSEELERSGGETADRAIAWLSKNSQSPFFLFVHLYDPHAPYHPPQPYASRYKNKYYGEVAYVDEQIGRLLKALAPVQSKTVIILTADHGEGLGEHEELMHALFIYDSTIHVPLMMAGPGLAAGKDITTQTRSIDVMPTALALAGLAQPNGIDGRSLVPLIRGESWSESEAYSETLYPLTVGWHPLFSARTSRWKYIESKKPELYDLQADPGETKNVVPMQPAVAHQFSEKLKPFRNMLLTLKDQQQTHDPELEEKLKSLGYLSGSPSDVPADFSKLPDPKDKATIWNLYEQSLLLSMDGKMDQARALIEKGLKMDDKVAVMFSSLARMTMASEVSTAMANWKKALKLQPSNPDYHHQLARCYRLTQQFQAAIDEDQVALQLDPQMADAVIGLGITYFQMGSPRDALLQFQKALEIDPRNAVAAHQSGTAFRALGDLDHAQKFYDMAITLNPSLPDPYNGLGVIFAQKQDYAKAESYLRQALQKNPNFSEAYFNLGVTYARQNRIRDALAAYKIFVAREKKPQYTSHVEKAKLWIEQHS